MEWKIVGFEGNLEIFHNYCNTVVKWSTNECFKCYKKAPIPLTLIVVASNCDNIYYQEEIQAQKGIKK